MFAGLTFNLCKMINLLAKKKSNLKKQRFIKKIKARVFYMFIGLANTYYI